MFVKFILDLRAWEPTSIALDLPKGACDCDASRVVTPEAFRSDLVPIGRAQRTTTSLAVAQAPNAQLNCARQPSLNT